MPVDFGRDRREEAATGEDVVLDVLEKPLRELLQPLEARRCRQCRVDHPLRKDDVGRLDRGELQLLLRAEVSEQPTLAHPHGVGQPAERKALEPFDRRELRGLVKDRLATSFTVNAAATRDRFGRPLEIRFRHHLTS